MSINDYLHDQAVAKLGKDPYDSEDYRGTLIDKIASAIVQAKAALAPVETESLGLRSRIESRSIGATT